ncbi:hypothetical protein [Nonomuraea sp. NPDC049625]|uniref:hypothetical protein n=1 Tax=Nonomuraea sp. NPDC049625 TaxID=3155775 RepID=UPI0034480E03
MLYGTCARSEEILDVEDLDLAGRRCPVKSKGAQPKVRHRGAVRAGYVLETVLWDAGTARPLPCSTGTPPSRARGPALRPHPPRRAG